MTLYEYAETIYNGLGTELNDEAQSIVNETSFKEMVSDDDRCLDLIRAVLEFKGSLSTANNKNRASHILVTWLLGIGFGRHLEIDGIPGSFGKNNGTKIWLQTAMIHDYGYFCKELSRTDLTLGELVGNYNLLADEYPDTFLKCLNDIRFLPDFKCFFTYDRHEIENYFNYSIDYHRNAGEFQGVERADHGIVGGCLAFKRFCERLKRDSTISEAMIQTQKVACYTAAAHNIFKSKSVDTDDVYLKYGLENLLSTSPIRITKDNLLLLLLSLVDTVECTKRFSKRDNPKEYLKQVTTLRKVNVEFGENDITIDFYDLYLHVSDRTNSEKMVKKVIGHVDAIEGLLSWTNFSTHRKDSYKVSISI